MAMQMKLQMRLTQQLIMTPQLQQAIKLLQLSRAELEELIDQAIVENPVLEESMDIDSYPTPEGSDEDSTEQFDVTTGPESFESAKEVEKEFDHGDAKVDDFDWQQYVEFGTQTSERRGLSGDDDLPSLEATLTHTASLSEHLQWQLNMQDLTRLEVQVGICITGNVENDGYLTISVNELLELNPELHKAILDYLKTNPLPPNTVIDSSTFNLKYHTEKVVNDVKHTPQPPNFEEASFTEEEEPPLVISEQAAWFVEQVLKKVQRFDPNGSAARTLQECLLIQLESLGLEQDLSYQIIKEDMPLLECKDLKKIARRHKQDLERVIEAYRLIMSLEPKPGRIFSSSLSDHFIIPDVYIYKNHEEYKVALNGQGIPRLRISHYYKNLAETMPEDSNLTKEYIQEKIKSGQWLMKSIEQRQKTIFRVTQSILNFQKDFFEKGIHYLRPLVLKDVAENISVHESTVSRITTNKYVHTPQGIFELKYFFTSGIDQGEGEAISSKRIKEMIEQLVQSEDLKSPYTDLQIADILYKRSNIKVARRTVAKYREALNILPSNKRKQLF